MYAKIIETFTASAPILIALIAYFIRLEIALAKLQTDVAWIKKALPGGTADYTQIEKKGA